MVSRPTPPRPPLIIGITATFLWFGFLAGYLALSWSRIAILEPDAFGDFLAGWFAPPAFFWLMITVWLQREELAAQREELARSTMVLEAQSKRVRSISFLASTSFTRSGCPTISIRS
ncbi:MAG: hypothetical protein ACR2J1_00870 [Methyloceanibacter sp.]|uniref:hypothetical protein n=1 Tax=Methyloceanibacter sp. TaxID=1965321 RepID=UPI003D9B7C16